jgi:aspartyl-tRNA(Asn)/glutamyl-tRNA(Gln) amidotransferase subunit A
MNDLHFLTIAQASRLIQSKELSPVEYVNALISRIEAFDEQLNAFITRTYELALEQARAAEQEIARGGVRGPLHGIPFALKDIYDTAGILTSGHSKIAQQRVPNENATTVERLYEAGAVLVGKLATHEFASGGPSLDLPWPPARNPWHTAYFTGSSSSGSGAAVAAGFVPATLGSDTGGSIRIPAALCGIAGLKPTYGRVSRYGVIPNSFTFDHAGPLAWTVEDCAILLQCIAGHDAKDFTSSRRSVPDYRKALNADIRGLRVGVVRHYWEEEAKTPPEIARAMDDAIEVLHRLGARIGAARMRSREAYNDVKMVIAKSEIVEIHGRDMRERLQDFGADFIGRNLPGFLFTAADYVRAQRERKRMVDEMEALYGEFDVLLTASSAPAARLDELIGSGFAQKWERPNIYTPFNVTGGPALSVCNGFTESGLPLAMQIAGRPFDEETVLRVGDAYERATTWRERRPQLTQGAKAPAIDRPLVASASANAEAPQGERPSAHIEPATRATVEEAITRAGLTLTDEQRGLLYRVAPTVLAAVRRIRSDHAWSDEPANAFFFDGE